VHRAMVEAIEAPAQDRFQVITEHPAGGLLYDPTYLGIQRTENIVMVQITLSTGRKPPQKRKLFKRMAEILAEKSWTATAGSHGQSGRSGVGELVVWQRRSAIYRLVDYSGWASAVSCKSRSGICSLSVAELSIRSRPVSGRSTLSSGTIFCVSRHSE